jgi:hypothetical protein
MEDRDAETVVPLTANETRALLSVGVDPDPEGAALDPLPLPVWSDPDLPGLARVRAAVRSDLSPAALAGFLTTPQPDLEAEGRAWTPAEWLRSGKDVGAVEQIARWI